MLDRQIILITYVEKSLLCSNGDSRDGKSLDYCMGISLQNGPVHESSRISLVTVARHILRKIVVGGCCPPFPPCREPGTAASAKPRLLHFCDHFIRRHLQSFSKRLIAALFQIVVNIFRIDLPDMAQSQLLLVSIEWILFLRAHPVSLIILIHKAGNLLVAQHAFLQNFRHILWLYSVVDQVVWHDLYNRPIFTESITPRCLNLRNHIHFCLLMSYLLPEGFY